MATILHPTHPLLVAATLLCAPAAAAAQEGPSPVHLSVGLLGAAGFPGPVAGFRFSGIGVRAGFDIDWGVLDDGPDSDDRFFAAQLRFLTSRREREGSAVAVLVGANHRDVVIRTPVRWPGGSTTFLEEPTSGLAAQIGVGFDWLGRRSRAGVDLVMGVGEAEPRFFAKVFVVWGGRVQVE
jgi:hypothetical protein